MPSIYNSKILARHRFYREPAQQPVKALSPGQRLVHKGMLCDQTADEVFEEKRQNCSMEAEEELPF